MRRTYRNLMVLGLVLGLVLVARPAADVYAQNGIVGDDGPSWEPAPLAWLPFEAAVQAAAQQNKRVLVDIYAPWCSWCRRMHEEVYRDPAVQSYLDQHFVLTRLNTAETEAQVSYRTYDLAESELAYGFGAQGTPTTVFLASDGTYVTRLGGYPKNVVDPGESPRTAAQEFLFVLRYIGSGAYQTQDFAEFAKRWTAQ